MRRRIGKVRPVEEMLGTGHLQEGLEHDRLGSAREIEDSIYDALEMRRQMQEKAKQKAEIFSKEKKGPVK